MTSADYLATFCGGRKFSITHTHPLVFFAGPLAETGIIIQKLAILPRTMIQNN
jgi:hypothetical protein